MIQYYKELLFFIKSRIPNKDYAQDLVQESYMKAIALQNSQEILNKRALLYKIAKNLMIDKARKNFNLQEVLYEEHAYTAKTVEPEEVLLEQDRQKTLMRALQTLPQKRKEAFVLHVLEGYSRDEVSQMMGISIDAVEKHLSRASIELKEKIKRKEGGF
ncbi:RNA polymerase sigma factor [Sulfurospirillum halorespirans]|uniref:Sigma factor, ECF subfamily n=1 Tax=Sulfurospirillum halorespirans DSM 13726 TaxID=1193502 RepID=A0A1D7TIN7_9BACT|nr:RNA polymerase sigma factor [Sulfurospirillum halorespirans]AOO64744.1 sigma factor, ECF subfamily [Sulfurospirillum halorespirans DSM 13726]